jgi:hypothetical protein
MLARTLVVAVLLMPASGWAQSLCDGPFTWGYCPPVKRDQQKDHTEERGTEQSPAIVKVITPEPSETQKKRDDAKEETDRKLADYTFDLFIATLVLAFLTVGLVVVGACAIRRGEQSTKKIERAYLAGGGDCMRDKKGRPIIKKGQKQFRMQLGNHGKTPAYLFAYEIKFCTQNDVKGSRPDLPKCVHVDQYPPEERFRHVKDFPIAPDRADVVYGAFHYRDIWRREWYSRFILRIDKTDWHTYADLDVDESWTKWI